MSSCICLFLFGLIGKFYGELNKKIDEDIRTLNIDNDSDQKLFPDTSTSHEYFFYGFWVSIGILIFLFAQRIIKTIKIYYFRKLYINSHRSEVVEQQTENEEML